MFKLYTIIILSAIFLLSACDTKPIVEVERKIDQLKPTVMVTNNLPNKHQIETAFIPQAPEKNWDQPWQDACEEAAMLTVIYYYQHLTPSIETMVAEYQRVFEYQTAQGWGHDVDLSKLAETATSLYGYSTKIIDHPSIEDIKKYISQDIPVIVPANGKTLFAENKHFKNGGPWYHAVVILGYNDNLEEFTVHDVGTQFGANFHYSYSLLMDSIHDLPSNMKKEDIETGEKRVMVLLK